MHVRQTLRQVDVVEPSYFLYFYLTKIKVQLAILAEFLLVFVPGGGGGVPPGSSNPDPISDQKM